jgi:hypothetical protein
MTRRTSEVLGRLPFTSGLLLLAQSVIPARAEGPIIAAEGSQPMFEYDKATRYMVKQDPANFFRWLWWHAETPLQFHSWLDARRLALPEEGDLT